MTENLKFRMELVKKVEQYPCLYNRMNPDFKNQQKREQIWMQLGNEMNTDYQMLMKLWRNLRDKYVRRCNKRNFAPEPNGENNFFHYMSFLDMHIITRAGRLRELTKSGDQLFESVDNLANNGKRPSKRSKTKIKCETFPHIDKCENVTNDIDYEIKSDMIWSDNVPIEPALSSSKMFYEMNENDETNVVNCTPDVATTLAKIEHDDVDEAFCRYLFTEMKNMTPSKKLKLKTVVMATILEAE